MQVNFSAIFKNQSEPFGKEGAFDSLWQGTLN